MATTDKLNILLLHDGKPGHYNQSDGIVAALARRRAVSVERLEVDDSGLLPARAMRGLASASSYPLALTERLAGTSHLSGSVVPDVVVSAGGKTLIANILLAKRYDAANIFSGSVRGVQTSSFSAILHVDPKLADTPPYIVGLKPSAIEPKQRTRIAGALTKAGMLVGGPTKTHFFEDEAVDQLVGEIEKSDLDWEIMTSRRTPDTWADKLVVLAEKDHCTVFDFRKTGAGGVADLLARVDCAVITDDSVSMISEAIAAGLPVVSLTAAKTLDLSDRDYLDLLQARTWYSPLPMGHLSDSALIAAAKQCSPVTKNHIDLLADRLFAQIPQLAV